MSKWTRYLVIIGMMCCGKEIFAQRLGLLPSKVQWFQLHHDSLNIVFPKGEEETAKRVASLMLKIAVADPIAENCRYKPISVLLQPQTNISNGYVGLAPYVSEFYLQPNENPFSLGSLPWVDLLAIHEFRHVQQINAANKGFNHLVKLIFGDLAFNGVYHLSVPRWFREGDAVYSETKWSNQGRGRLSSFTLPFKEKLRKGETWNYYKVRNGSYKEFTPDEYALGYLMVEYGNQFFREATWDTILRLAPNFGHVFSPFSGVVQDIYGKRNKFFYHDAMEWYRDQWKWQEMKEYHYPLIPLQERDLKNDFFDMTYPKVDDDGSLYTAITTFDHTTAIYRIEPDGKREKVVSMGLQQDTYFDQSQNRLVWTELRFDPRWLRKDKNVLVIYDMEKGNKKSIQPSKGFFTPALDATGEKIVVLHVNQAGQYNLQILDASKGNLIASLPNDSNLYLGYPIFSADGQHIISTARNRIGQMSLVLQNIESGSIRLITPYSYYVLGRPAQHDDWIFVTGGMDQLDQVFAVNIHDGIFYQVSVGNSAHYDPAWDPVQEAIVCAEYHLNGKKLVRLPGLSPHWEKIYLDDGIKFIPGASDRNLLAEAPVSPNFEIKKYSSWANVLNAHSWLVTADDPFWGVEGRSNNIMNTISLAAGYEYNRNSKAKGPYVNLRLGMWFPELSFGFGSTSREIQNENGQEFNVINDRLNTGITLPLYFNSGVYQQLINLSSFYFAGVSRSNPLESGKENSNFNYVSHRVVFINSRKKAYRQPLPTWGQRLDFVYSNAFGSPVSLFYASGDLALPAFKPSHYFLIRGEYLEQEIGEGFIQLGSSYAGARGFDPTEGETQYRFGATYGFPILYPNRGIGNIFYTRRIRMQPFFDIAYTDDTRVPHSNMRSAGAEIIVDFDFPPISVGVRYARLLDGYTGSPDRFQFFIPSQRF